KQSKGSAKGRAPETQRMEGNRRMGMPNGKARPRERSAEPPLEGVKTVELFAGIGGFRLAADRCHVETLWANDISVNACKVYRSRFGDKGHLEGDIRQCKS